MRPYFVLLACLFLANCGGDPSVEIAPVKTNGLSAYTAEQLKPWRELCIDEPSIEAKKQECLTYQTAAYCEARAAQSLAAVSNEWEILKIDAEAHLNVCNKDFRVTNEYCRASYEEFLSTYVSLCKFYR